MLHKMKLNPAPFNAIMNQTKTIELRLYDDKRARLSIGDTIIFSRIDDSDRQLAVRIKGLYRSENYVSLFEDLSLKNCGFDTDDCEEAVKRMEKIYAPERINKYGVLGISIELISLEDAIHEE